MYFSQNQSVWRQLMIIILTIIFIGTHYYPILLIAIQKTKVAKIQLNLHKTTLMKPPITSIQKVPFVKNNENLITAAGSEWYGILQQGALLIAFLKLPNHQAMGLTVGQSANQAHWTISSISTEKIILQDHDTHQTIIKLILNPADSQGQLL